MESASTAPSIMLLDQCKIHQAKARLYGHLWRLYFFRWGGVYVPNRSLGEVVTMPRVWSPHPLNLLLLFLTPCAHSGTTVALLHSEVRLAIWTPCIHICIRVAIRSFIQVKFLWRLYSNILSYIQTNSWLLCASCPTSIYSINNPLCTNYTDAYLPVTLYRHTSSGSYSLISSDSL